MKPIQRNLLLQVKDAKTEWGGGIIRPDINKEANDGLILIAKADDCACAIPIGSEVLIDYESEDLASNITEIDGKRLFIIREDFAMAYFDPEDSDSK